MSKTQRWAIFTLVAAVVVFAAGWMLLISPQRSKASDLRSQATAAQQQVSTLHAQLAQLLSQKKNLPAQQRILAQIATKIPADPAEPTLIRQLQDAAHTAGVDMTSLSPQTPTQVTPTTGTAPSTTGTAPSTSGSAAGATTLPLWQIPLSITVTGNYFNVELFEHSLEKLPRAMLVSQLSLTPPTADGSTAATTTSSGTSTTPTHPGDVTATITATVFLSPKAATPTSTAPSTGSASG